MVTGPSGGSFQARLSEALASDGLEAYGSLLERYRGWLSLLARLEVDGPLQAKVDPQDVVQETLLQACRDRHGFRGTTEAQFAGWLRGILAHVIAHEVRRYREARMRDLELEVELEVAVGRSLDRSSAGIGGLLVAGGTSPSGQLEREEEGILLAGALMNLPEDYREVIVLRSLKGLPYEEVARRMERSPGAARMLWVRALALLKEEAGKWNL